MKGQGVFFVIGDTWIKKLLSWADQQYPYVAYFSPNSIPYPYQGFEHVFFAGTTAFPLEKLKSLPEEQEKVGILGYDLKNHFEKLKSSNPSLVECPESLFFLPELKIVVSGNQAEIFHSSPERLFEKISACQPVSDLREEVQLSALTSREEYLQKVKRIKEHIIKGDLYEMNFCMAFQGTFKRLHPVPLYFDLMDKSPMPFSIFFKGDSQYLLSASPERFLKKDGSKIIAQPIKGTIKRGNSPQEDELLKLQLKNSQKEQAENLMIVDLMRNDLARISVTGTVKVEELFGIYGFKRISQMISTVSSTLKEGVGFEDIIAQTFPMGSMTGAPKIRCMELIDEMENFKRGWFSGAAGYISSQGDFDFNVLIRSIVIDKKEGRLFFAVGSAITYDADPTQEYDECLLKAEPVFEVLTGSCEGSFSS